jgi:hypothetical protein
MRFLSTLDPGSIKDLDSLNQRYFKWLEEDYTRRAHSGLGGKSPHEVFMSQVSNLKLVKDVNLFNENFLLRVSRKIQHDATTQVDNVLYETDPRFIGKRVEIRYEPEWINDITKALPIYDDNKKVGEAKMVHFHDNSHVKRKFPGNRRKDIPRELSVTEVVDSAVVSHKNIISYYDMMKGEDKVCSDNISG